jgi:DNA sulfur modification protein DndB
MRKIPAIRGIIGNTIFYTTNLTFSQINEVVRRVDSELHTSTSLKEEIQRSLTSNYKQIKDYILNREDFFFDSLVLAVYDGEPLWTEVRYEIDNNTYHNVGLIELSGEEKIFPVDGQHRVEGIKAALKHSPELGSENISVILIGHSDTPEGRQRSRRIFSTLNRYVKPVRLGDIIALDEDDIVAIATRELLETHPLFMGNKIKASNTKSIPKSDKSAFTSLMTLYSCNYSLLSVFLQKINSRSYTTKQLKEYLKIRPSEEIITEFINYLADFWNLMCSYFPEIGNFAKNKAENAADKMRSNVTGGNLFFRPIGLLPFVEATVRINLSTRLPYSTILEHYSNLNRDLSTKPWRLILWNPLTKKMIMRNQSLVKFLLIYRYDSKILNSKEIENMITKYATIFNMPEEDVINDIKRSI